MECDQRQGEDGVGEPVLPLAEQADEQNRERHQPQAAQGRGRRDPERAASVACDQRGLLPALGEREDPVLGEPGRRADRVAEHRPAGDEEDRQRGDQQSEIGIAKRERRSAARRRTLRPF